MRLPHLSKKSFLSLLKEKDLLTESIKKAVNIVARYFHSVKRDGGKRYSEEHLYPIAWTEVLAH